ncbi:MAG: hypothetical protein ACE148_12575 [Vicinamibacterales bacterium]
MNRRPLVFGVVILAAMAAAAGGGYLATRHGAVPGTAGVSAAPAEGARQQASRPAPSVALPKAEERPTMDPILRPVSDRTASPERTADNRSKSGKRSAGEVSRRGTEEGAEANTPAPRAGGAESSEAGVAAAPPEAVRTESKGEPANLTPLQSEQVRSVPEEPEYDELVVPAESVIGLQLDTGVSSATAAIEDVVEARVTRDVVAGEEAAIPAGSRVIGSVTLVEHGGKMKERGRIGIRFHTVVLPDGTRTSINTETVYRESASPAKKSAAKIGGAAAGGAVLGAILGGKKGAVIGGTLGAAGGTAVVMAGNEQVVDLAAGTILTVRLLTPVGIVVRR